MRPDGLLVREKSGNPYVSADEHAKQMRAFREAADEEALATQRTHREAGRVHQYIEMLEGTHWPKDRRSWRSPLYTNRMAKARTDTLSALTDIKPTLEVKPRFTGFGNVEQQAEIAAKVIQSEWIRNSMILQIIECVDHALLATGYLKIGGNTPGSLSISACGFDNVLPIHPTGKLQDAGGVVYRAFKPLAYYWRVWPEKAKDLMKYAASYQDTSGRDPYERPFNIDLVTWKNMSVQMKYKMGNAPGGGRSQMGGEATYFPVIPLGEYWIDDHNVNETSQTVLVKDPNLSVGQHNWHYKVKPGERLFPYKRLAVFGGQDLLTDGPNPYWHGRYPFAKLDLNPVVWGHGSMSRYRDLVPLNKAINEIIAGVHDLIRRALNPQMITRRGAVHGSTWANFSQDRPGEKLMMTKYGSPSADVRYIDPPAIPSYVYMMLMQFLVPEFERVSGFLDVGGLMRKNQTPGGDTIEQMRDAMQSQLRLESLFVEQLLIEAGELALSNVFQFFTAQQRLNILGPDGITMQDYDFDPGTMAPHGQQKRDHWKVFSMQVSQGSLHGASRDREKQITMTMRKMNAISNKEFLRRMGWTKIKQIMEELQDEQQAQAGPEGEVPRLTRGARNGNPV